MHHLGYGFHADRCASGILAAAGTRSCDERARARAGVRKRACSPATSLDAGHRVIATDASPAMLELARDVAHGAEEIRRLVLPDDPIPECDAIVSIGHVLSYLPDEASIDRALVAAARALRPGGVFAIDLCDLRWGEVFRDAPNQGRVGDTWAIITQFSLPRPDLFVREMTPSSEWRTARGVATRSGTRTCSSTRLACRRCSPSTVSRPAWRGRSVTRSFPRGW